MGGAGVSNPLARGRGPRAGGSRAGGMANPMLRSGGGGDMGGLARGAGGIPRFSASSSSVGTTGGRTMPPPPPPPPRDDEGSLSPGPATMPPLSSSPTEVDRAPAIPAAKSWGPSPASVDTTATAAAAAGDNDDGDAAERPPTEFRAIGSNGSWPTDGAFVPPRRRAARGAQLPSETERDPGQEKVGGLVKALQKPDTSRFRLMLHDTHNADLSASGSSLSNLGEKGLVQLRRAKYSPRPAPPGLLDPKETEVDA
ncbi:unnamed protein product [Ectocarpus fasciculatus]